MTAASNASAEAAFIGCPEGPCEALALPDAQRAFVFHRLGLAFASAGHPTRGTERRRLDTALDRFPTVRSCLSPDAGTQEGLDLTRVDWASLNNRFEAEVCLARILDRIASVELSAIWLDRLGFEIPQIVEGTGIHAGTALISPIWAGKGQSPLAWGDFGILAPTPHGLSVRLRARDGAVLSVSLISNRL